jgi:hypothetical protein
MVYKNGLIQGTNRKLKFYINKRQWKWLIILFSVILKCNKKIFFTVFREIIDSDVSHTIY